MFTIHTYIQQRLRALFNVTTPDIWMRIPFPADDVSWPTADVRNVVCIHALDAWPPTRRKPGHDVPVKVTDDTCVLGELYRRYYRTPPRGGFARAEARIRAKLARQAASGEMSFPTLMRHFHEGTLRGSGLAYFPGSDVYVPYRDDGLLVKRFELDTSWLAFTQSRSFDVRLRFVALPSKTAPIPDGVHIICDPTELAALEEYYLRLDDVEYALTSGS